jgi:hypothetical protein
MESSNNDLQPAHVGNGLHCQSCNNSLQNFDAQKLTFFSSLPATGPVDEGVGSFVLVGAPIHAHFA